MKLSLKRILSLLTAVCILALNLYVPVVASGGAEAAKRDFTPGYRDLPFIGDGGVQVMAAQRLSGSAASSIPSSYDMRAVGGLLPAIRNQNPYGTCWSFASVASAESNMIKNGIAGTSVDLSEMQLVYFNYNKSDDPLGNFTGDYNYISNGETMLNVGGNSMLSTFTLARWTGVADESVLPYSDALYASGAQYPDAMAYSMDRAHLQNSYWLDFSDQSNEIKKCVMEYGAVNSAYWEDGVSWSSNERSYYQSTYSSTNHAIAIVGWDDNYSRYNFRSNNRPGSDGAWLIRNSWGENAGDGGYFWLSYNDASLARGRAFVFDFESADNYDNNYQYDGSSSIGYFTIDGHSSIMMANIFTAAGEETLEAVGFFNTGNRNVDYIAEVYLNPTDPADPTSGVLQRDCTVYGHEQYAGYHTATLAKPIELKKGDVFAVAVSLTDADGDNIGAVYDSSYNYGWVSCNSTAAAGQSFYSIDDGYNWFDYSAQGKNLRIKAFTKNKDIAKPTGLTASRSGGTVSLTWNAVAGADGYEVYVLGDGESEYAKLADTVSASYSYTPANSDGKRYFYKVRAKVGTALSPYSLAAAVVMPVSVAVENMTFTPSLLRIAPGENYQTQTEITPADATDKKISYYSDNVSVVKVSQTGMLTGVGVGNTLVHAVTRNGNIEKIIDVTVAEPSIVNVTKLSDFQTLHPYANNLDQRFIWRVDGAATLSITFDIDTYVEDGFDYVTIYDGAGNIIGKYTGTQLSGKKITIPGNSVTVMVKTDYIGSYFGIRVADMNYSTGEPQDLAVAEVSDIAPVTYTGSAITPGITVKYNGTTLVEGTDYIKVYADNINAGEASVTLVGIGAYTGEKTVNFTINPVTAIIVSSIATHTYTGAPITPEPVVRYSGATLVRDTDYILSYSNNINAGTATVGVTGKGNYAGVQTRTFRIMPSTDYSVFSVPDGTYTGSQITPEPTVRFGDVVLTMDIDYFLSYTDNINAGKASVKVTGIGNFGGEKSVSFTINPASVFTVDTVLSRTYTGAAITPEPVVRFGSVTLVRDVDYTIAYSDNVNFGTAKLTVTGVGNFTGSKTSSFIISKASAFTVESPASQTYTGSAVTPEPVVSFNGTGLVKDIDFTLSYNNNTAIGTATVFVTGKGNFTGTKSAEFEIVPKPDIAGAEVSAVAAQGFTGAPITPSPAVSYNGTPLVNGIDYTLGYANNVNAGTAEIRIIGTGAFAGEKTVSFVIAPSAEFTVGTVAAKTYTAAPVTPEPVVRFGGATLIRDTDYTVGYSNNITAGQACVTVTGIGNYAGVKNVYFVINPTDAFLVAAIAGQVYTGAAVNPEPLVKFGGATLVDGTDYTTEYYSNIAVGTASVTVTGMGNFTGTKTVSYTISPTSAFTVGRISDAVYTGAALTPEPAVSFNGIVLVKDTDFTLEYADNVNAGTAKVTVTGKGNFTGSSTVGFAIVPTSAFTVEPIADATYNGTAVTPAPVVKFGGTVLEENTDYTVAYSGNVDAGTAKVTVTGKGNFTGVITVSFNILPAAGLTVAAIEALNYTGEALTPNVAVSFGGIFLTPGTDYTVAYFDNVNAGTASVTVTGRGNYADTVTATFKIKATSQFSVASVAAQTYTGQEVTPEPVVRFKGKTLVNGTDYTVYYSENIESGTAFMTVVGRGNFTGNKYLDFDINPTDAFTVEPIAAGTYMGAAIRPEPVVMFGEVALVKWTDYTVSYSSNLNAGTASVNVTGMGNFTGVKTVNFTINPSSEFTVGDVQDYTHTGAAIEPKPAVKFNGVNMTEGTDYTVGYLNNTDIGTASVVITGKGNFTGVKSVEFEIISEPDIADAVVGEISDRTYTGSPATPSLSVTLDGIELKRDIDYTVEYSDNTDAGTASVKLRGIGSYIGEKTVTFTINPASGFVIGAISGQAYTGSAVTPELDIEFNGIVLVPGRDCTLVYSDNVNAGTARVTVTGKGNFTGEKSAEFDIRPTSGYTVAAIALQTYTGAALTPEPVVVFGGATLVPGTDYAVMYRSNTDAGTATMTVTGIGNYSGVKETSFTILPTADFTVETLPEQVYIGSEITPEPVVSFRGAVLREGIDYMVEYTDNVSVGTGTARVRGKGNFAGEKVLPFKINPTNAFTVAQIAAQTYMGGQITPNPVVTFGGDILEEGKDYTVEYMNNVDAGTAGVTVIGKGSFTGSKTVSFTINPASGFTVDPVENVTHTGARITPVPTVRFGDRILVPDTDYTVSYLDNTQVGTASIIVTGKKNFTGSVTVRFEILPKPDLADSEIAAIAAQGYTGRPVTPKLTVIMDGEALAEGKDYTVEYADNIQVGTASATVTGMGRFTGKKTVTFSIDATDAFTVGAITAYTYTGAAIAPEPAVEFGGAFLVRGVDYTVEYVNNTDAGTATVKVTGIGRFTGVKEINFTISPTDAFTVDTLSAQVYTGLAVAPEPLVSFHGTVLRAGIDYTVEYTDNTAAGIAGARIRGKGNFTGERALTFIINPTDAFTVEQVAGCDYTGGAITPEPVVRFGETLLVRDTDYTVGYIDNVNAGMANITVTGIGSFTGDKSVSFTISPAACFTVEPIPTQVRTGAALTPGVTVRFGGTVLAPDTDYTVEYASNTDEGTATATITGKGNFTGSVTVKFEIVKPPIAIVDRSGTTVIDTRNNYLYGLDTALSAQRLTGDFIGSTGGRLAVSGDTVGTGTVVTLLDEEDNVLEQYTVIIRGDINGDGVIDSADVSAVSRAASSLTQLDGFVRFAADVNGDGLIDSFDVSAVSRAASMLTKLEQG